MVRAVERGAVKLGKIALPQLLGLLVLVGTAAAAVTLTYSTHSTQSLAVKTVPIVFEAGADATASDYVPSFSLTANHTAYTASLRGVPEATVVIDDLVHVRNTDTQTHTLALASATNTNPFVTAYKLELFDGATSVAVLDFKAASPSASVTLPAGVTLTGKVTITLASGAGNDNVADTLTVTTSIAG
ncbi:MAG: hypothetical protein WDA16_12060 [Candidatus Thermoplasmatota archaeon]